MSKYFDFVLCEGEKETLFHAPRFSGIKKGDLVIVETERGERMVKVASCITLSDDRTDIIDFIMNATHSTEDVRKVVSRVRLVEMTYEEDVDDE